MDDIILGYRDSTHLEGLLTHALTILTKGGFTVAPKKVQKVPPFKVLRSHLTLTKTSSLKALVGYSRIHELNFRASLEKLIGCYHGFLFLKTALCLFCPF